MVEVVCMADHNNVGGEPAGFVVATFETMQDATNRGLEESYSLCEFVYVEKEAGK